MQVSSSRILPGNLVLTGSDAANRLLCEDLEELEVANVSGKPSLRASVVVRKTLRSNPPDSIRLRTNMRHRLPASGLVHYFTPNDPKWHEAVQGRLRHKARRGVRPQRA